MIALPGQGVDVKSLPLPLSVPKGSEPLGTQLTVQIPGAGAAQAISEPPSPRKNAPYHQDKPSYYPPPRTPKLPETAPFPFIGEFQVCFKIIYWLLCAKA